NTLTLSVGAQPSGGTYLWSNGSGTSSIDVEASGDYSVLVTNQNNCTASDTITVTVTPTPVLHLGADTMICTGTGITLDAGSQAAGTTFLWNTSDTTQTITVSNSGMYSVMADNNG